MKTLKLTKKDFNEKKEYIGKEDISDGDGHLNIEINLDEGQEAKARALQVCANASKLTIKGQAGFAAVNSMLKIIKVQIKAITAERNKITKPLNESKSKVMDFFRQPLAKLAEGEMRLKELLSDYISECEKKKREHEAKLQRQAEAEERKKRETLAKRAEKAEEKGNEVKAQELREQAEEVKVEAPILADNAPKAEGLSYRIDYSGEVVDFERLPDMFKLPNYPRINQLLKVSKGQLNIAGIKVIENRVLVSRGI